jgi:GNAT superfamily N-acetyltransferase
MPSEITIRAAQANDVPSLMKMIHDLALFEKAPEKVWNTEAQLMQDGFGTQPKYQAWVADAGAKGLVGMAIAFEAYSTWKGRFYYLDDLYIHPDFRRRQIGEQLIQAVVDYARQHHYPMVKWQVLEWNENAIAFYEKLGVEFDPEWVNCHYYIESKSS